jgi:hypothetical protein
VNLVKEMARVARRGIFVIDLHRNPVAYFFYTTIGRLFLHNRLIREDGALSILKSFTPGGADRARPKNRPGPRKSREAFSVTINPERSVRTGSGSDRIMKCLDRSYMIYKIDGMHSSSVSLSY